MNSFPHTSIPLLAFAAGDAFGEVSDDTLLTILTIKSLAKVSLEEDAAKLSVDGPHSRTQEFEDEVKVAGGRLPGSGRVNPEKLNSNDEITITDQVAEQLKNWSQKLGI